MCFEPVGEASLKVGSDEAVDDEPHEALGVSRARITRPR